MSATVTAVRSQVNDLIELTKPRIALMVVVTAWAGMWLAAGGAPPVDLTLLTLLGIALASGAGGALNNFIDRDVDARMVRTRHRALPGGRIEPAQALMLGLLLAAIAFVLLYLTVNALTAVMALGAVAFYVGVYTAWLKRSSVWCTEIGGVAGALPPLIGWAAVTNSIGIPALILFLIVMLWQPPHFWALALVRSEEYRRAGLPMLPVVRGERATLTRMLFYTVALLPATSALYFVGSVGEIYLLVSLVLGLIYLLLTIDFARKPVSVQSARRLFAFSIVYLLLLFVMVFIDCRCGGGL